MPSSTASSTAVSLLVAGMLLTGISNSLFTKYQDMQCVGSCDDPDVSKHVEFSQPVWQTAQMFLGECLCLLPVAWTAARERWTRSREKAQYRLLPEEPSASSRAPESGGDDTTPSQPWWRFAGYFFAPAVCDICGTTLMNVGLLFTPVSIYQMTRGALVLWVGIFSVIFLRRYIHLYQWLSLLTVMLGVCVVGLSGTILKGDDLSTGSMLPAARPAAGALNRPLSTEPVFSLKGFSSRSDEDIPDSVAAMFGVLLILFAQLFTATQFVLEEKVMSRFDVEPLLAVGFEGIFGLVTVLIAMPILHFFYGSTAAGAGGYFDMRAGWSQIIGTPSVLWSSVAIAISIALFNGCGLAVTRAISATARSTIDTCRTLGIWIGSLLLGWEVLRPVSGSLQGLGFLLLVYGTLVFNAIIRPPKILQPRVSSRSGRSRDRNRSRSRSRARSEQRNPKAHRSQDRPAEHSDPTAIAAPDRVGRSQTRQGRVQPEGADPATAPLIDAGGPSSAAGDDRIS